LISFLILSGQQPIMSEPSSHEAEYACAQNANNEPDRSNAARNVLSITLRRLQLPSPLREHPGEHRARSILNNLRSRFEIRSRRVDFSHEIFNSLFKNELVQRYERERRIIRLDADSVPGDNLADQFFDVHG
jgi:hypothetical protein